MCEAEETKRLIDADRRLGGKDVAARMDRIAFDRCRFRSTTEEYGWGPAVVYEFADGSVLTFDGRGYLTHAG